MKSRRARRCTEGQRAVKARVMDAGTRQALVNAAETESRVVESVYATVVANGSRVRDGGVPESWGSKGEGRCHGSCEVEQRMKVSATSHIVKTA